MRFLVDNSLAPALAALLANEGHDAVHVRSVMNPSSDDTTVFDFARAEDRVIIAADTDFGAILAEREVAKPSVVLVRTSRKATVVVASMLVANLSSIEADVSKGAVIVFEDGRIRVRSLPIP
jgi:predicted nuclease of predicted toxin-antitoxin system